MKWLHNFIDWNFSKYKWGRRWLGGKWERMWVDPCSCYLWQAVEEFTPKGFASPGPSWYFPPIDREKWPEKGKKHFRFPHVVPYPSYKKIII